MNIRRLSVAVFVTLTLLIAARPADAQCSPARCAWVNFDHFDDEGNAVMKWGYNLDGYNPYYQQIELFVDDGSGFLVNTFHSNEIQTYVIPAACTTQPHNLAVFVWLANFYVKVYTPPPPPATPSVSATLATNSSGQPVVRVAYSFRYTRSGQRSLSVSWDGGTSSPAVPSSQLQLSGTVDLTPPTCWKYVDFYARTCGSGAPQNNTHSGPLANTNGLPHVDVGIQKSGATKTALITYQFTDNQPNTRSLTAEFLPDFPATTVTPVSLPSWSGSSGTISTDVSNFGTSGILRVRASNSCLTDVKDTFIDCDCDPNGGPSTVPRPVRLWDGSMTYTDADPLPSEGGALFTRNYDTLNARDGWFGTGWRSAFDAGLSRFNAGLDTVTIQMEGERKAAFVKTGNGWTQTWPSGKSPASLTQQGDGTWQYRDSGSSLIRIFRPDGRFGGFDDQGSARKVLIDYSATGQPQRVYAADGTWSCPITVTGNRITAIAVDGRPDLVWQYSYSGSLLQSVTLSGGSAPWRSYQYTAGLLSAVHDAAGNLIESHTFDANGRAIDSIGVGGTDIANIEYDLAGSLPDSTITRVTYASGEQTTFEQRFIQGRQQTFAVNGGCGSCESRDATYAVDPATGLVMRKQDARGYISSFAYDNSGRAAQERHNDQPAGCDPGQDVDHCRLSAASLPTATLQSTTASTFVTYAYGDPLWPDKPTTISMPSIAKPGDFRVDTTSYDPATGIPLTSTSSGWSSSTATISRTTTVILYDGAAGAAFDPGRNFSSAWLTLTQPAGKRRSIDGPRTDVSDVTMFVYYPVDSTVPATYRGRPAATKNAAGHITTFENYDVFGNAGRVVDANGVATESMYDALGRVVTTTLKGVAGCDTVADALCGTDLVTTRTYTPATGPLTSQVDANGNVTTYEYDSRERLTALSRGASANALKERIEYTYDAASGHKNLERYLGMENGSWVEKRRESFTYDALGQLTAQTHADATSIGYTYDVSGSVASTRDENHTTSNTRNVYDPARRLSSVHQTLGTAEITTAYAYDVAGNLVSVTDPNGNITSYAHDDLGRMVSQASPVTGTTTYSYDAAGNLNSTTDANNAATTRTYDSLGRVVTSVATLGSSSETVTWTYDGSPSFRAGRLATMTDPAGSTSYTYDRRGLLLSESRSTGAALLATSFRYDANGNRSGITYPSGISITYAFDYANRPLTLDAWGGLLISSTRYLPFGPESEVTYGNGLRHTRIYDSRYRIQRNTLTGNPGMIADYSYAEDAAGNITSIQDMVDASWNRDFAYDDLNRLVTATSGSSLWGPGSYRYDAMGNLLARDLGDMREVDPNDPLLRTDPFSMHSESLPVPGSVHESYAYLGTTPKLATITWESVDHTMTYDAAGNETRYFTTRTYSPRNLLSSIAEDAEDNRPHTVSYGYDGRGVRVVRSEGTTGTGTPFANRYYVYSPELNLLAMSVDDNPNVWGKRGISYVVPAMKSEFLWYNGRPVGQLDGQTIRYTFSDHLGTPILQTDFYSSVIWRAEYEPYGDTYLLRAGTTPSEQPLRFPGQEYERKWEGTEERYNIFRWYRAGWGRYTQADPAGLPGVINLYAYVDDDPVNWIDPFGETKHCMHATRVNYIGYKAWQHHTAAHEHPTRKDRLLFNLLIFDARCDDCKETIDVGGAYLRTPPQHEGAAPLIMNQFTNVLSNDAVEFDVSVKTRWVVGSPRKTFDDLAKTLLLCYECKR